jgi:hypothetical protein
MAYARWVFKGSLVDEYGLALPPVVQAAYGSGFAEGLNGITLFANGHVMQMLEGESSALQSAICNVRDISKLFGMVPLLQETIDAPASTGVAVGLNRFVETIAEHLPSNVHVFPLTAQEIHKRTVPGAARELLLGFVV